MHRSDGPAATSASSSKPSSDVPSSDVPSSDVPSGAVTEASARAPGKLVIAVVAGLLTFLLATAWTQERERRESTAGRREQLADLVAVRERRIEALERQLDDARRRMDQISRSAGRGRIAALQLELAKLAGPAGTGAVTGAGIVVRLSDSTLAKSGDPESADFAIQDVDVQLVVNALWDAGAEAISINGQRVIGTTAIRSAGGAILVNYRVLSSPYRVTAIGDQERLERRFAASAIARRFRSWVEAYKLGFSVTRGDELSIPAYAGSVRFRYARPASPAPKPTPAPTR